MTDNSLTEYALNLIDKKGKSARDQACQEIIQFNYSNSIIDAALKFYAKNTLSKVLPIFPTLINLSCNAVGGQAEKTKTIATAMMLVTASGDIHDDIIDKSTHKFSRKTVFGKYGKDIAILAGDALLLQGITLLNNCSDLSIEQRKTIIGLVAQSIFEMIKAESTETCLWKRNNVSAEDYFDIIRLKGSAAELQCRIGGIVGSSDEKALDEIAHYGRIIGILSTMKEEFIDMQNMPELWHRINYELPPYPIIYALHDDTLKKQVIPFISKNASAKDLQIMANIVLNSRAVQRLKSEMAELGQRELTQNPLLKDNARGNDAVLLLRALANEM
jgi:geranylgeranyl pyrophosphate synthase